MTIQRLILGCARCQAKRMLIYQPRHITELRTFHIQVTVRNKEMFNKDDDQNADDRIKRFESAIEQLKEKQSKKLFPDGFTTPIAVAFMIAFYTVYSLFKPKEVNEDSPSIANEQIVNLYRKMPLKSLSRVWGKMTCWELPMTMREPLLGLYVWLFNVQLHEAEDSDLKNYKNLSEFFRRQLKPNVRIVDPKSPVTSPADGKVLHYGKVEKGIVEQVKGVNYSIKGFLGPLSEDEESTKPVKDCHYQQQMNIKPGNELFHCIIYLAPGDYHRFHSPCNWKIASRRHFPGELLSVNPGVARWVQGLFNMNERAVYTGTWEHGYFSYTAVGATNVGSIKIYFDENLETNTGGSHPNHIYHDRIFEEKVSIAKGEMIGEFNLGSTVVLLFEAPANFQFGIESGQKVKFGEPLGDFVI